MQLQLVNKLKKEKGNDCCVSSNTTYNLCLYTLTYFISHSLPAHLYMHITTLQTHLVQLMMTNAGHQAHFSVIVYI